MSYWAFQRETRVYPKVLLRRSHSRLYPKERSREKPGCARKSFSKRVYSLDGPPAPHASLGGQTLSPPVLPTTGRPALTVLPNHGTSGTTTTAGAGALHPVSTLYSLRCSLCTRFHLTLNHNKHSLSVMYIPALTSLLTTYTLHQIPTDFKS